MFGDTFVVPLSVQDVVAFDDAFLAAGWALGGLAVFEPCCAIRDASPFGCMLYRHCAGTYLGMSLLRASDQGLYAVLDVLFVRCQVCLDDVDAVTDQFFDGAVLDEDQDRSL